MAKEMSGVLVDVGEELRGGHSSLRPTELYE